MTQTVVCHGHSLSYDVHRCSDLCTDGAVCVYCVPETDADRVERLRAKGYGPTRILSALGHPGYGVAFARRVLDAMDRYGLTAHEAVYGGVDAQRKIFLARERGGVR